MADEGFKRKLTAILSADVVGYSLLMENNEEATIQTLNTYRNSMSTLIQQHRGRVVDTIGDNLLAEFASAVDAVNCAVEIQRELAERNTELPYERKMEFRIGVNVGDVVEEEDRIYGEGVNIAARVESMAEPGGICISGRTYDQVANRLEFEYENLGEHQVKNISTPIRVYRVLSHPGAAARRVVEAKETLGKKWRNLAIAAGAVVLVVAAVGIWQFYVHRPTEEPASLEKMAFPLPEMPSIVVLPFINVSGEKSQEYISDGLTETLITSLSKVPNLFVIARESSFYYKGKSIQINQISEELGVRYVLEGSVQRSGNRIRITAQLIDALKGHHLWAEKYDRQLEDLFALQDDIALNILRGLQLQLTLPGKGRGVGTDNLEAYLKSIEGLHQVLQHTEDSHAFGRQLYKEAIVIDPEYADAYSLLGYTHLWDAWAGTSDSPQESLGLAEELAQKAIGLDSSIASPHCLLALIYLAKRQYDKALAKAEEAFALDPNDTETNVALGMALQRIGRAEEAIPLYKKVMRLNPHPPNYIILQLSYSYVQVELYDEAIDLINKWIHLYPNNLQLRLNLIVAYIMVGRDEDAKSEAAKVLKSNPKFSIKKHEYIVKYNKDQDYKNRVLNGWRKAGLPEHPPLKLPDKPSIAVLPFKNLSGDPEQEYFSDGLTETLITSLSNIPDLFVIARESSFYYKGKSVKIKQISNELGVRYILEGSVQRSGNRIRINAQLIDATKEHHLWAEKYDRELEDLFALQDDIALNVLRGLQVQLTQEDKQRGRGTDNLEAYLKLQQGNFKLLMFNENDNAIARQLFKEAIALDPEFVDAYSLLGYTHLWDAFRGWSSSPKESFALAKELAQKAIALDNSMPGPHGLIAMIYLVQGQCERALAKSKEIVANHPEASSQFNLLGMALSCLGRPEEAISQYKKELHLNPYPQFYFIKNIGAAYIASGRYEELIELSNKWINLRPDPLWSLWSHLNLAAAYHLSGREKDAKTMIAKVLKANPELSVRYVEMMQFFVDQNDLIRLTDALQKAGLPE